jgi:hypothetical protein
MKMFLPKVFLSLGVVIMTGSGFAMSASAQTPTTSASPQQAVETACAYPFGSGLPTNGGTIPGTATGTCWTTNTIPGQAPAVVVPAAPATTTPPPTDPTPSSGVQTASPAPIISTTASTNLAFTGADIWQSVLLGLILIGGGALVVALGRRRRAHRLS